MRTIRMILAALLLLTGLGVSLADSIAQPDVPVQDGAPWPLFRYDHRNTGRSEIVGQYTGDAPWSFQTGKGIFSTPVIDADGVVYVGSADHVFYALAPDGRELWRFRTREIIDSAAALPQIGLIADEPALVLPGGDGYLYALRTDPAIDDADERLIWQFDSRVAARDSFNNWFEGNVALGFDGTIYAGNTNFNYYAVNPDGSLKWVYETTSNNWSIAAIADDGTIYWGSNDTNVHAVTPEGEALWTARTLGFIAASAAIGSDGTVYIGSFDSNLYALDPADGSVKWRFKTDDHIYSSVALGQGADGGTNAIYFGSADGRFYAVTPEGDALWQYDTGAPIRSSAALGTVVGGGEVLYFGNGDGQLFALNAADGTRRWSFDTTAEDGELRDRNDLNASIALGETGVYTAGEHGQVWYVPYDYCLNGDDTRCNTDPGSDLPDDFAGLVYVTPGGTLQLDGQIPSQPAATMLTLRMVVREDGQTLDRYLCNEAACSPETLSVQITPEVPFTLAQSADSYYLHIRPDGLLEPETRYTVRVSGMVYGEGRAIGNMTLGGDPLVPFETSLSFDTLPAGGGLPVTITDETTTAIEWTRLAVPVPPMMPSLNQIGFDYIDWLIGVASVGEAEADGTLPVVLWAVGAQRDERGVLVVDHDSDFTVPLSGVIRDGAFILENGDFTMNITGIPIPFGTFELRGAFDASGATVGATAYAEADAGNIPTFGPYMAVAGLANPETDLLVVGGTYVTRPLDEAVTADDRPAGVAVDAVDVMLPEAGRDGLITVTLAHAGIFYPEQFHRGGLLLVDRATGQAVPLDYHNNLSQSADADGNLGTIELVIPADTMLPEAVDLVILTDVYPLEQRVIR